MSHRICGFLPALLAAASMASAQSPFIGEWKLDPSRSRMPDEMKVESQGGNKYTFDFGGGAETIVADGTDQPGYGGTLLSVKAEAPDTWIVQRKKDNRLLLRATWKLSKDGRTLTDAYRQFETDGSTTSMDYVYERSGGGSGFAADWQSIKETMNSTLSIRIADFEGAGLTFITPFDQKPNSLKFEGKDDPTQGPKTGASQSLRRVDERTLMITSKAESKVTSTQDFALSTDLKTLTMTLHFAGREKPTVLVFDRK